MTSSADWLDNTKQWARDKVTRLAGTRPAQLARMIPGLQFGGPGARVLAGYGGLAAGLAAALELTDQNEPLAQNVSQGAGTFLGGGVGSLLGGALIGGPIGMIAGGVLGSMAGRGVGDGVYGAIAGDPNDPLKQQQRAAAIALEQQAKSMRTLMPLQAQAAAAALATEKERARYMAELENDRIMRTALAQGLLAQQQSSARSADEMTRAILGSGGGYVG